VNAPLADEGEAAPQILIFTPAMRRLVCDAIESLILLLDEIDGDAEIEDDGSAEDVGDAEPSLGAPPNASYWVASQSWIIDGEGDEHDGREPDEDFEPNAASTEFARE
jgi:hypothetical protein